MSAVDVVAVGPAGVPLDELPGAARRASAPLLWILHSAVVPDDGALPALLDNADRPAVSMPVDPSGAPVEAALGRFTERDAEGVLAAVQLRRVPLRHAPVLSLLVEREIVMACPPPRPDRHGPWAGDRWTARMFARHGGVLVPASRVRIARPQAPGSPVQAVRMARSGTWARGEALGELARSISARGR